MECLLRNHIGLKVDQCVHEGQGVLALKIWQFLKKFSCFEVLEIHLGNWDSLPIFLTYCVRVFNTSFVNVMFWVLISYLVIEFSDNLNT